MTNPTQQYLNECFSYSDGIIVWKVRPKEHFFDGGRGQKTTQPGTVAGYLNADGYLQVDISGKCARTTVSVARVIYIMHYGCIPDKLLVDHKDTNRANNCIENLRLATSSQNAQNQSLRASNASGVKGVSWHKSAKCWEAKIGHNGKQHRIGLFATTEMAAEALSAYRAKLHGIFANNG